MYSENQLTIDCFSDVKKLFSLFKFKSNIGYSEQTFKLDSFQLTGFDAFNETKYNPGCKKR